MVTDEERHEVASQLRFHACCDNTGMCSFDSIIAILDLIPVLGLVESENVLRIADLIDHPTCRIVESESGHACCSRCGASYLCMREVSYCPQCEAEVVCE